MIMCFSVAEPEPGQERIKMRKFLILHDISQEKRAEAGSEPASA
jgi:hypothetical protein